MPHRKSVMHGVAQHGADDDERGFDSKSHLMAMLYAQLAGASSLREIEICQASHAARLYHLGATPAARSTLVEANRDRDSGLFTDLFMLMVGRLTRRQRLRLAETAYLIDATMTLLPVHSARRAPWRAGRAWLIHAFVAGI